MSHNAVHAPLSPFNYCCFFKCTTGANLKYNLLPEISNLSNKNNTAIIAGILSVIDDI